jgi:60 kDa SS-A/Ro ribonucleoprotein
MKLNKKKESIHTHEGAKAKHITPELALRRSVMACLLWEKSFYEDGVDVAKRISELIPKVDPLTVAHIAVEARNQMYLRHMPLFIIREMATLDTHKHLVAWALENVIQRADEPAEFLAMYWQKGRQPLSAQVKKGLAAAFTKFERYHLQKYNRDNDIKLRDVLFLTHPKAKSPEQQKDWDDLVAGTIGTADTWEVTSSDSNDNLSKKEKWEKIIDMWIVEDAEK